MTGNSDHPPASSRRRPAVVRLLQAAVLPLSLLLQVPALATKTSPLEEHLDAQFDEFIQQQARELGTAIGERAALQRERREQIGDLRQQLTACGNCARRQALQEDLDRWLALDRMVAEAERGALASMGLGQYGSVDEMKAGLNAGLAQWARQLEAEARHRKDFGNALAVVARHCELKVMPELPAHCGGRPSAGSRHLIAQRERACVKEFHVAEILADDRTVRELCGRTADAAVCIRKSSLLARMSSDSAATLATLRVRLREQREAQHAAGLPPPSRGLRPTAEETERRRRESQEFADRMAVAKTPEEVRRVRQEHGARARERNAERVAQRAEARRLEQACEVR